MGDTLVLETSAFEHESSNLSIPTKDSWIVGRTGMQRFAKPYRCKPELVRLQYDPPSWKAPLNGRQTVLKTVDW
jgi:hypothetical protein